LETKKPGSRGVIPKITIRRMTKETLWTKILKRLGQRYREKPTVEGIAYHHTVSLFEMQKRWAGGGHEPRPDEKDSLLLFLPSAASRHLLTSPFFRKDVLPLLAQHQSSNRL
jgi:hypothetical protein